MDKQLRSMFEKRFEKTWKLVEYIWEHRKELVQKYKDSEKELNEDCFSHSFFATPEEYVPEHILNCFYNDGDIDRVNSLLDEAAIDGKMTKSMVLDYVIGL